MQHLTPFIELCDDRVPYDTEMQPNIGSHSIFLRRALNRKFHETFQKEGFSDAFYRRLNLAFRTIPRLALYVPFNWLDRAPDYFISTYLDYWQRCLTMQDARENFNLGDIYEPEARIGEVEYIVKAMHLLPDLLRIGYLDEEDVVKIAQKSRRRDPLLCHSLLDTLPVLCGENLMQQQTAELILRITREVSPRPAPPQLAFVTPKREAWLAEMAEDYQVKPQYISGPFSLNCDEAFLAHIANLDKTKIALIGGSRLKGYARDDSDYDVAWLDPQTGEMSGIYQSKIGTADPNIIHLLMNTVWASANDAYSLKSIREEALRPYFELPEDSLKRARCLCRLESDLVQYRLMHKGFKHTRSAQPTWLAQYPTIDGASAFYDDDYREIATTILMSYLIMPTI